MSFSKNFLSKTPFLRGGYEGGGDVEGAYYIPTGQMYADMFGKKGPAVSEKKANQRKLTYRHTLREKAQPLIPLS